MAFLDDINESPGKFDIGHSREKHACTHRGRKLKDQAGFRSEQVKPASS